MGKTYLYSYESLIMHGLPDRSLAMAGVRLASKVEISRVSHSDHLLQVNLYGHRNPHTHQYHAAKDASFIPSGWQNKWQKDIELPQKLWALPTAEMTLQAPAASLRQWWFPSKSRGVDMGTELCTPRHDGGSWGHCWRVCSCIQNALVTGRDLQRAPQAYSQPAPLQEGAGAAPALLPSVCEPPSKATLDSPPYKSMAGSCFKETSLT